MWNFCSQSSSSTTKSQIRETVEGPLHSCKAKNFVMPDPPSLLTKLHRLPIQGWDFLKSSVLTAFPPFYKIWTTGVRGGHPEGLEMRIVGGLVVGLRPRRSFASLRIQHGNCRGGRLCRGVPIRMVEPGSASAFTIAHPYPPFATRIIHRNGKEGSMNRKGPPRCVPGLSKTSSQDGGLEAVDNCGKERIEDGRRVLRGHDGVEHYEGGHPRVSTMIFLKFPKWMTTWFWRSLKIVKMNGLGYDVIY